MKLIPAALAVLLSSVSAFAGSASVAPGAFLYSPADQALYACRAGDCSVAASKVTEILPDALGGLYAFGAGGIAHCVAGACSPLQPGVALTAKVVRAGGKLYGTSAADGTWMCEPSFCRRLSNAYFDSSWPGAFDARGFWGSGPQGTFRCDDNSCRRLTGERLEVLFSVGTKAGLAWGGSRTGGTWRCTETACESKGGLFWYNTYAFDAAGNLFGSSGFPDSTYACSDAGCRHIDDLYRYWHGPDARGGMLASTQVPAETHLCDLNGCKKVADGKPAALSVIGPVASSAGAPAPVSRATKAAGLTDAVKGDDGAVYGVREGTYLPLGRRDVVPSRPGEIVRVDGGVPSALAVDPAPSCWSWEHDEDGPSAWENSCVLY